MKRVLGIGFALMMALPMLAWASSSTQFTYTGSDNSQALTMLVSLLRARNVELLFVNEETASVGIAWDGDKILLLPKFSADGLDRIIVHSMFSVKSAYIGSSEVIAFVNMLNDRYNMGCTYISQGKTLVFMSHATFLNTVTWDELKAFLDFFSDAVMAMIMGHVDDFVKYLQ